MQAPKYQAQPYGFFGVNNFSKPIVGCCAFSGTGKTTLLAALIPSLIERGIAVSVIKHAHHSFQVDHPGKDSYRLHHAGAQQVVLVSKQRIVCMTESPKQQDKPALSDALAELKPELVDLVLVEGFKHEIFAKILLHRPVLGKPLLLPLQPDVIAVASSEPVDSAGLPLLDLNQPLQIVDFIIEYFHLANTPISGTEHA